MAANANVTVHHTVWSDPRYDSLARILGRTRKDVIGCMVMLWSECTDRQTECPPEYIINGCLDSEQGAAALVKSGLGELTPEGVRVRGCKGRIEWIENKRKAGAASAKKRADAKSGVLQASSTGVEQVLNRNSENSEKQSTAVQQQLNSCSTSGTQVLRYSGTQDLFTPPASGQAEPAEPKAKKAVKRALPEDWAPNAKHADKAQELGVQLGKCAEEFRNYWGARGDTMKNWDLAFFTWLGNAVKFAARANGGKAPEQPRYLPVISDTTGAPDPEPWKDWL